MRFVFIILLGLTSLSFGLDRADVNRIIRDGNANGIQSLDAQTRTRLNAALAESDAAIDAIQTIDAESRNALKAVFPVNNAFAPTDLSGLEAWYKSGVGVTLNGGDVSQWDDQSGNARHLTQGTAANQPLYNASDANWNGLASITFNGTSDFLLCHAVAPAIFQGTDKAWTIVTAVKRAAGGTYRFLLGSNDIAGGGNAQVVLSQKWNSVDDYVIYKRDTSGSSVDSHIGTSGDTAVIIRWQHSGTLGEVYVNGASAGTSANNVGALTSQDAFCIGAFPSGLSSGATFWTGDIAEVVMYSRLLTAGEQTQIEDYFKSKFATY
jgi:hypothetical protein